MKNQTKAERIFNDTRRACSENLKVWGRQYQLDGVTPITYGKLFYNDDENISTRTCNDVERCLKLAFEDLELFERFKTIEQAKIEDKRYVLRCVEICLKSQRKNLEVVKSFREER